MRDLPGERGRVRSVLEERCPHDAEPQPRIHTCNALRSLDELLLALRRSDAPDDPDRSAARRAFRTRECGFLEPWVRNGDTADGQTPRRGGRRDGVRHDATRPDPCEQPQRDDDRRGEIVEGQAIVEVPHPASPTRDDSHEHGGFERVGHDEIRCDLSNGASQPPSERQRAKEVAGGSSERCDLSAGHTNSIAAVQHADREARRTHFVRETSVGHRQDPDLESAIGCREQPQEGTLGAAELARVGHDEHRDRLGVVLHVRAPPSADPYSDIDHTTSARAACGQAESVSAPYHGDVRTLLPSGTVPTVVRGAAGIAVIAAAGVLAGFLSGRYPELAVPVAIVLLLLAIAFIDLTYVLVIGFLASVLVFVRAGPMSVADLALGLAMIVALLMIRGRGVKTLQPLLWAGAFYLALTLPQLVLNRYIENYIEWAHEVLLVIGAALVGFVIGREGKARLALSLFIVLCSVMALFAIASNLTGGGGYVGPWHKNAIGAFLMYGAIIAFANPPWMGWRPIWAYAAFGLCGLGMLSSRQALVGTLIGVLIIGTRPRFHNGKRSRWMPLLLIPTAWFIYLAVVEQLTEDNPFNSASQRLAWYVDSVAVWLMSPIYGVGHRWWTTGHTGYGGFQPPNAELEVLTTTGILGLVGFLGMFGAAIWLLWRMDPVYGTIGLATVVARLAQGQLDLYWVAGHASLLWIVAGICYGVKERDRAEGIVRTPHPVQTVWRRTRGVRTR